MISPMCQYSAAGGSVSDWHLMHLGQLSVSGAGLLMMEMTNVEAIGRISPHCVGLYNDENERAVSKVVDFCHQYGNVSIGVQLAHAGRKASTQPPWMGRNYIAPHDGGWQPVAPSPLAPHDAAPVPRELMYSEVIKLIEAFADSAARAHRAGFAAIELHAAHGYLLHQFLSPLSNRRNDAFGGSLKNRMRLVLDVFAAVRDAWPADKPVGVRVSATDWAAGGWNVGDSVRLSQELKSLGCDWIDVSSGGLIQHQDVVASPAYQVPLAAEIRAQADIPVVAVGLITEPLQAEHIVQSGSADVVALARAMLYNPRWPWHAARALNVDFECPDQYRRCLPAFG